MHRCHCRRSWGRSGAGDRRTRLAPQLASFPRSRISTVTHASIAGRFDIDQGTYDRLIVHARSDMPFEVCGLLASEHGTFRKHYEIPNAARSMTYYQMDPKPMLAAFNEIDDSEWDLQAIYHSHTHTEAYPSSTDIELAFYPEAVYL